MAPKAFPGWDSASGDIMPDTTEAVIRSRDPSIGAEDGHSIVSLTTLATITVVCASACVSSGMASATRPASVYAAPNAVAILGKKSGMSTARQMPTARSSWASARGRSPWTRAS